MGVKHKGANGRKRSAASKGQNRKTQTLRRSHLLTEDEQNRLYEVVSEAARNSEKLPLLAGLTLAFLAKDKGEPELTRAGLTAVLEERRRLESEGASKRLLRRWDKTIHLIETNGKVSFEIYTDGEKVKLVVGRPDSRTLPPTMPSLACNRPISELIPADLDVSLETNPDAVMEAMEKGAVSTRRAFDLALRAYRLSFRLSYDELLCLPTLRHVKSLAYQEETARKVLSDFRGQAILAAEVGLGKTIEAGIIFKEYLMRGLIRSALILTPSSLVNQWHEELKGKFDLEFISSNDRLFHRDPQAFWAHPFVIASLQAARRSPQFDAVVSRSYDLVIVDEAHHLKSQNSKGWQLVNTLKKSYLLLLTATPVHNKLDDIYHLVNLVKPGRLKTHGGFKAAFVSRGQPTTPRNREQLRELLRDVMIRNTRATCGVSLPARIAVTKRVELSDHEVRFYEGINKIVVSGYPGNESTADAHQLRKLLERAGSSCFAATTQLERMEPFFNGGTKAQITELIALGHQIIPREAKALRLIAMLRDFPDKAIVFVKFRDTLEYLRTTLDRSGIAAAVFHGKLNAAQKQGAVDKFREGSPILLATGIGGEGHNLQFCNVAINYDLPWNPMEIEHRIGRVHRIGQERDVEIYNLCGAGTIEDHILEVLDNKINMFELVVGELGMIVGRVEDERDFAEMVFDLWARNPTESERRQAFEVLAEDLKRAKALHDQTSKLSQEIFEEDFEI